jgi:hypothetical protein
MVKHPGNKSPTRRFEYRKDARQAEDKKCPRPLEIKEDGEFQLEETKHNWAREDRLLRNITDKLTLVPRAIVYLVAAATFAFAVIAGMGLLYLHYLGILKVPISDGIQYAIIGSVIASTVTSFVSLARALKE